MADPNQQQQQQQQPDSNASTTPQSTTPQGVLMVSSGQAAYVPLSQVDAAQKAGAEMGVRMTDPKTGDKYVVPFSQQDKAQKNGATWDVSPDNDITKTLMTQQQNKSVLGNSDSHAAATARGTVVPINPDAQAGASDAGSDVLDTIKNIPSAIWHSLPPVALHDSIKQSLPVLNAYEQARSTGASVPDAIQQADIQARKQDNVAQAVQQKVADFKKNPTRESVRGLFDAAALAATVFGVGESAVAAAGDTGEAVDVGGAAAQGSDVDAGAADATHVYNPATKAIEPIDADTALADQQYQRLQGKYNNPNPATSGILDKGKNLYQQVTQGAKTLRQQISLGEDVAQAPAQSALRQGAQDAAENSGVGPTIGPDQGLRTVMERPIAEQSAVEGKLYDTLNDAAETDMKSLYDRQEELTDALEDPTQVANKTALQTELKTTQANIAKGEANVQAKLGADAPKLLTDAKNATQNRYAMENFDQKIFNNESVVSGNAAHGVPEQINVKSAIRQMENLDKPSKFAPRGAPTRLQQALGEDGAKAFKQGLYDAQKAGEQAVSKQELLHRIAGATKAGAKIAGGLGTATAAGYGIYKWLQ